ncbi:hypothetical protein [Nocardia sp. NPDC058633]|uniref:hypothetical protein n=1 Tax=Nocardia sp. NPDC058633 TaxID=3346568 RepID=UPI00364E6AAB
MTVAAAVTGAKALFSCAAAGQPVNVCEIMAGKHSAKTTETDNSGIMDGMNFIDRTTTCR